MAAFYNRVMRTPEERFAMEMPERFERLLIMNSALGTGDAPVHAEGGHFPQEWGEDVSREALARWK